MTNQIKVLAATVLAGAAVLAHPVAAGEPQPGSSQTTVQFRSSELGHQEGAKALLGRMELAARRVCGRSGTRTLQEFSDYRNCRKQAVADAVNRINRPILTAAHSGASSSVVLAQRPGTAGG